MIAKVGIVAAVAALVGVGGMAVAAQVQGVSDTRAEATVPQAAVPQATVPMTPPLPSGSVPALPAVPKSAFSIPEGTITVHETGDASALLPAPPALPKASPNAPDLKAPDANGSVKVGTAGPTKVTAQAKADGSDETSDSSDDNDERDADDDETLVSVEGSVGVTLGG